MNRHNHQLTITRGPEPGKVIPLSSFSMTIGRDPMSEITINDPEVSRRHASLSATSTGYEIQDLGSTNGTFVDGIRLGGEPVALQAGQVITIGGGVELVYEAVSEVDAQAETVLEMDVELPEWPEPSEPVEAIESGESEESIEPEESMEPEEFIESGDPIAPPLPVEEGTALGERTLSDENLPREDATIPSDSETAVEDLSEREQDLDWLPPGTGEEAAFAEATAFDEPEAASSYDSDDFAKPVVIPHEGEERISEEAPPPFYRRLSTIIAAVLLLILCCCCGFLLFFYYVGGDWLLRQMGLQ